MKTLFFGGYVYIRLSLYPENFFYPKTNFSNTLLESGAMILSAVPSGPFQIDSAKQFFESPELIQIRRQAGVKSPEFIYLNQLESGTL